MIALRRPPPDALATHVDDVAPTISVDAGPIITIAGRNGVKSPAGLANYFIASGVDRQPGPPRRGARRALVVGPPAAIECLLDRARAHAGSPLVIVGACAPEGAGALRLARALDTDLILLAGPAADDAALVETLAAAPAEIVVCDPVRQPDSRAEPVSFGAVTGVRLLGRPLRPAQRLAKAAFDRAAAALLLVLLAPLLALIALAIRLDSHGPVIYRQRRHGLGLAEFEIFKFRTLHAEHGAAGEEQVIQVQPNDPRVTRVGRILRHTSLDELPQLLNVLMGSMSLVGPRPHPVDFVARYGQDVQRYLERHRVIPGMTGRAQVQGLRGPITTLEDIRHRTREDLAYVSHRSFVGDLAILLRSLPLLVGDEHMR